MQGDSEALIVHYALQKLHILPSVLLNMPKGEYAIVCASIISMIEKEKKDKDEFDRRKRRK